MRMNTSTPTTTTTSMRRLSGITIPEGHGEKRRRHEEGRTSQEEDPADLRGKRPVGEKKKKERDQQ